ncbi:MAG TPA: PVC-type heme-binding CxxCH protein, partial [Planctomycetota bacterium]|nr:PVC-type heme-binding CxxCH protein [Planctomycetota bacterium]
MRFLLAGLVLLPSPQDPSELEAAQKKLRPAAGLSLSLWASEPLLQNPVAISFDEKGRLFVAECHRRHTSTLDIHMRKEWLDDDLACRRHEDQVAYHEKRLGDKAKDWMVESERIRILEDKDGKGRANDAVTFSDGYNHLCEGIGAGILVRDGKVWYTCIPNLWLLQDTKGDGHADVRKALHHGFGVHLGASGHDMHGLRFGPDGKIYWSHGDRGFNVESQAGKASFPDGGGVLRANPDGSDLEVVCVGLRNPQELAFDDYGNLFTGDNNISIAPDVGETCRWTYIVEGADYGWRIGYQFMPTGGAWCGEEQWRLEAGFQVPCVARLGHGPSGVTHHPGVAAIPERYRDHFFMCDYPGGVWSFAMRPKGASFEMVDLSKLVWEVNAPDVEFGNDGAVYVADWAGMWDKADKGRIWRLVDPAREKDPAVLDVKRLIEEGMSKRSPEELSGFLAHPDQRIRQNAQFELVALKLTPTLSEVARKSTSRLARIHALWGLGQLSKASEIEPLLSDGDAEVRAQAAKVIGNLRDWHYQATLVSLLRDESPRVRFFAALGLGKVGKKESLPPLLEFLRANGGEDRMLQHAGIMGLTGIGDVLSLSKLRNDGSPAVRMAAAVALRKLKSAEVAWFLGDGDPKIALEAVRAIYDTPIEVAMPALAARTNPTLSIPILRRQVNALYRMGMAEGLAFVAAAGEYPAAVRQEALELLGLWEKGLGRDRLMGLWRPVPARDRADATRALAPRLPALVRDAELGPTALGFPEAADLALEVFRDPKAPGAARAAALRRMSGAALEDALETAVNDPSVEVAREGVRHLKDPGRLEKIVTGDRPLSVRQAAVGVLANDEALARIYDAGLPAALQLEWSEAAAKRPALRDRARSLEPSLLEGGEVELGRRIFFERTDVQCVRCHKISGTGGEVGPDLTRIDPKKDRAYLLESIVLPNKVIAEGWGQTAFQLKNDSVEVGRIEKETPEEIVLIQGDGIRKTIPKAEVKARKEALSAMPE